MQYFFSSTVRFAQSALVKVFWLKTLQALIAKSSLILSMTKYIYKGQEVTLVPGQQFTTHWNVYYQQPTEHGGSKQVIICCQPGHDLQLVDDSAPVVADKPDVANKEFNINSANFTMLRQHLPGIGRVAPKTILNNKPQGGYKDFEHFTEVNKKLNLNWEELKPILLFE